MGNRIQTHSSQTLIPHPISQLLKLHSICKLFLFFTNPSSDVTTGPPELSITKHLHKVNIPDPSSDVTTRPPELSITEIYSQHEYSLDEIS